MEDVQQGRAVVLESLRTLGEVAETLGISYRTTSRLLESGRLPFVIAGGRRLVEDVEVATYIARNRKRRVPKATA